MKKIILIVILIVIIGCKNNHNHTLHASETISISGDFVLFLRPNDSLFAEDSNQPQGIYEADSDFGFAIVATIDSLDKLSTHKFIKKDITEKRFVKVEGCLNCPVTIDRDTIPFGIIFTAPKKNFQVINSIHSGDYLSEVNNYFGIE